MKKTYTTAFKRLLKASGIRLLQERMAAAERAMQEAQVAANNEEKSSVGDKYETARSMSQLDKEMNARQLEAARQQVQHLQQVNVDSCQDTFVVGSVARIGGQYYFLSVGLGGIQMEGKKVWYLSPQAPLSKVLLQKQAGDTILFQGKNSTIEEVF
ncbi:MAG: hypothetical protein IPM95_03305 [Sphingobacteriales bacterium]|jgi:hypothetical protein|nr:hypothetical protein [Sphingobacteriales bacterium]